MPHPPIMGHKVETNPNAPGLVYKSIIPNYPQYPDIDLNELINQLDYPGFIKTTGYLDKKLVGITVTYKNKRTIVEIVELDKHYPVQL